MRVHKRGRSRGIAALGVVMVLFFILAMVGAYTNRNLVFEQRTSANSYRAARSLAAADAAICLRISFLFHKCVHFQLATERTVADCRDSSHCIRQFFRACAPVRARLQW